MEPEICTKIMLRNLSEKLKFPESQISCSYMWLPHMVKIAHVNDALSELFELEASLVEGQSLQQKDKKVRKRKGKKKESPECCLIKNCIFGKKPWKSIG